MRDRPVIMLHYVKEGLVRSPNIIFDRIEKSFGDTAYQFVHLNQKNLPSEVGIVKVIRELYFEIRNVKPDIIHISGIAEGLACMIAATFAKCPKRILITHGLSSEIKRQKCYKRMVFKYLVEPITLLLATDVQCNSCFTYHHKQIKRFANKKRRMIYNIPSDVCDVEKIGFREKFKIERNKQVFVSVGRIEKDKGFEDLANVIKEIKGDSCFVIIGEGNYLEEMRKKLKNEINNKKVIFLGKLSNRDVNRILLESSVFVLPTLLFETFGLVYIEAAFMRLPSIGTDRGAVPEVIENKKSGFLIEPGNKSQLKAAINYFITNPQKAKEMGEFAYKWGKEKFEIEKIIQQISNMYQEE